MLITNIHSDSVHFGKVYTEDKLSELLKDEGIEHVEKQDHILGCDSVRLLI